MTDKLFQTGMLEISYLSFQNFSAVLHFIGYSLKIDRDQDIKEILTTWPGRSTEHQVL